MLVVQHAVYEAELLPVYVLHSSGLPFFSQWALETRATAGRRLLGCLGRPLAVAPSEMRHCVEQFVDDGNNQCHWA